MKLTARYGRAPRSPSTAHELWSDRRTRSIGYDALVIGTGAVPIRPPIEGLAGADALGLEGVHLLHSMDDTFAIMRTIEERAPKAAVIVGAGYIGLEMAEALTSRGISVTQIEQLPEVLPTVDPELGDARPCGARRARRRGPAPARPSKQSAQTENPKDGYASTPLRQTDG